MSAMKDFKPYVTKALYDWIIDNGMTPQIIVNTGFYGVDLPAKLKGGLGNVNHKVLLNISPTATAGISFDTKASELRFYARFTGETYQVRVPYKAIESIFARENGEGNVFKMDYKNAEQGADHAAPRNHLRIVK